MSGRLEVRKTYKLFIGGAFPRSESGRTFPVTGPDGRLLAHVARASRKDARDAVRAARGAQAGWAGRTAYNRAQIIYRVAEVLEGRAGQLAAEREAGGVAAGEARRDVEAAVDAAVYWAGFADKLDQVVGGVNPVSGPYLNLSHPVPLGVCALACPDDAGLRGVLGLVLPAIMAGNAVVAVAGGPAALVTSTLGEVVATSDVPGGVVNLLTGDHAALLPWLADHEDVDLIDLSGAPHDLVADLERRAADNLKRTPRTGGAEDIATAMAYCEIRTVWHPGPHLMLQVAQEVAAALAEGRPVVALESTIIAHGLPRPENLAVARRVEDAVRAEGAVPATVAVLDGALRVGLDDAALEQIAARDDVAKLGVRDLGPALVRGGAGATTVASTAHAAALAGIAVFATGGLGGVHREASVTFDESADLLALAATPIVVVCAGVKSILDVGATLERLETLSVPVLGFGTDRLAGFYLADSGHPVPWRVDDPAEVAAIQVARRRLDLPQAVVVAQPLPDDEQMDRGLHDRVLAEALAAAAAAGATGKEATPFVLARFHEATAGESLRVNVALVLRNAGLAARVAGVLAG